MFGFVCHPFLIVWIVVTQLGWSMGMVDADLAHPPLTRHLAITAIAFIILFVGLRYQCRPRHHKAYHPSWRLFDGRLFEGQLRLEMPWWLQTVCGSAIGVIVALIDESEVMTWLLFSKESVNEIREFHGPRGGVPHMAHPHDGLLLLFILHGWLWTILVAGLLGAWSNAATLHRSQPVFQID